VCRRGTFSRVINDPIFASFDTTPSYVTNTMQPQQSQARQMVQLTLIYQKIKRNLDSMTLLDSDDERGDKTKIVIMSTTMRARSTRRVLEIPTTTTPQATRQRRPLLLLLQSLGKKIRNLST
jgi:hypothetical protein